MNDPYDLVFFQAFLFYLFLLQTLTERVLGRNLAALIVIDSFQI